MILRCDYISFQICLIQFRRNLFVPLDRQFTNTFLPTLSLETSYSIGIMRLTAPIHIQNIMLSTSQRFLQQWKWVQLFLGRKKRVTKYQKATCSVRSKQIKLPWGLKRQRKAIWQKRLLQKRFTYFLHLRIFSYQKP